jgi:hypothetical protein
VKGHTASERGGKLESQRMIIFPNYKLALRPETIVVLGQLSICAVERVFSQLKMNPKVKSGEFHGIVLLEVIYKILSSIINRQCK